MNTITDTKTDKIKDTKAGANKDKIIDTKIGTYIDTKIDKNMDTKIGTITDTKIDKNMDANIDKITLIIPLKSEYVSIARLTASGIASRTGFSIDDIEDIKVAVSEVFNKLIAGKETSGIKTPECKIEFIIEKEKISILVYISPEDIDNNMSDSEDELSLRIINVLMDNVEFTEKGEYIIKMTKLLKRDE